MKCLRTLGVLSVTISFVWSMTLESTSLRYLEDKPKLNLNVKISKNNSYLINNNSNTSHVGLDNNENLINLKNNSLNYTYDNGKFVEYENDSLNNNENFTSSIIVVDSIEKSLVTDDVYSSDYINFDSSLKSESKDKIVNTIEGRKIKLTRKVPSKDKSVGNLIGTTVKETKTNLTKSNNVLNKNRVTQTTSSSKRKTSTSGTGKNKIKVTTKRPVKITSNKQNTTAKPTSKSSYASNTLKPTKPTTRPSTKKSQVKIKTSSRPKTKPKPTIKKILTKWTHSDTNESNLKQNWYENAVPYPNPMPEITSSSPPFSIASAGSQTLTSSSTSDIFIEEIAPSNLPEVGSINPEIYSNSPSVPLQGVPPIIPSSSEEDLESVSVPSASSSNPISTFNLDMVPSADLTRDTTANGCPSVHISSSVLTPLQRQGCSDLNLVLNTHYHQNQDTRVPQVSTYDAEVPEEDDTIYGVDDDLGNAGDPTGIANAPGVAADPGYSGGGSPAGGSGGSGGSAGSGGSGGSGGDNGSGGFKLPDLKPMFEALGYLMRGLWWLVRKLMNPWLYIVPITLFFGLGFLGILALFPWWIPLVFLFFSIRGKEPNHRVEHVKHYHKPVVVKHHDGWYWDHHTQSWKDAAHYGHRRRGEEENGEYLDDRIMKFGEKYKENENNSSIFNIWQW